jgi:hypothetical protein
MNGNLSKTPRTDAAALRAREFLANGGDFVSLADARQLETELTTALKISEALGKALNQYGKHFRHCLSEGKCTCGLNEEITTPNYKEELAAAQEREEGLRRALEEGVTGLTDTLLFAEQFVDAPYKPLKEHAVIKRMTEALAATPSGPKFRERMQEAWKLVNAMAGQEPWQRAEDWLEQNKEFAPLELVRTKGLE